MWLEGHIVVLSVNAGNQTMIEVVRSALTN